MGIVYLLLPATLLLALFGVLAFVWAARDRQFDGVDLAATRLLAETRGTQRQATRGDKAAAGEGKLP